MLKPALLIALTITFSLPACAVQTREQTSVAASEAAYQHRDGQLDFILSSGKYSCEHGLRVEVQRDSLDNVNFRVQIAWNGANYELARDLSYSGLPRFEDSTSGLVWIDLPWKSVLLDGKTQKPLANECRAV